MKHLKTLCCLFWFALLASNANQAVEIKHLVVGVEKLNYFPHYNHEGGELFGYAREVLDAFANSNNYTIEYRLYPVTRLYNEFLKKQTLDFKYPANPNWRQSSKKSIKIYYSQSVSEYIDGVIVLPTKTSIDLSSLETLGTIRHFTPWGYLDSIKSGKVRLSESDTMIGLLKMAMFGRIDGAYVNIAVARYHLNNTIRSPNALVFNENLPYIRSSYYLSSIKYPKIIEKFDQFLIKENELIERYKEKFNIKIYF